MAYEGEPNPIRMFGSEPVGEVFDRATTRRTTWSAESAIIAIAMMAGKSPRGREIGARLAVMAVTEADGILPPGARPTRRRGS